MKILHYSLGFPPYRTGGMTKFCMDLMGQQLREGHEVALLWPGEMTLFHHGTQIKCNGRIKGVISFEVKNPVPIPYDEGIINVDPYMDDGDENVYRRLLKEWKPDVIHIHTMMGLHKAFFMAADRNKIKMIFTAHDFFPICPKVTMFRKNQVCSSWRDCSECPQCNTTALSVWKGWMLQHPLYRKFKNFSFVKKLRKKHRDIYHITESQIQNEFGKSLKSSSGDYIKLRDHYQTLLRMINGIHFNSSITKQVYESVWGYFPNEVIPITHLDIADQRQIKKFSDKLRLTYLGGQTGSKGFFLLKEALDQLWIENINFELNVFFTPLETASYMNVHEQYAYDEMRGIFESTDLLVVPSIWFETFGYVVLEALSFGVPVLVSGNVGAKDIIPEGGGIIIDSISPEKLCMAVKNLTPECLSQMNKVICEKFRVPVMERMSQQIWELYNKL